MEVITYVRQLISSLFLLSPTGKCLNQLPAAASSASSVSLL